MSAELNNRIKELEETIKQQKVIIVNEVARREKAEQETEKLKKKMKEDEEQYESILQETKEYLERFGGDEVEVFTKICMEHSPEIALALESEEEEEEEEVLYEDEDDWFRAYGYKIKNGDYSIHIQGGCEDWIDYVINRKGCFVRNMYGDKKVFAFVSCPEGNYVKVWNTPHDHGGLKLREGETDIFEMIKECFQEQIMDYETDETDESDSEEEEEEEEVVQDINGKNVKTPTEEECQKQFGISKEEFMMLAKKSDCNY